MKKLFIIALLTTALFAVDEQIVPQERGLDDTSLQEVVYQEVQEELDSTLSLEEKAYCEQDTLKANQEVRVSVIGQGVAPTQTISPSQAYALAKRAAIGDAYRLIAEKVKGVYVEGQDVIRNMMVKRTDVRTYVNAVVRDASIVETTFKEGLCEVEMEIVLYHSLFAE
jgi:outer membrane protein FlgP